MAIDAIIPKLWSAKILENLRKAHVFKEGCNRDYEGEIKGMGDALTIFSVGRPTINDYTPNSSTITYEELQVAGQVLTIDQNKDWAVAQERLDAMLSKVDVMNEATREAAWGMADAADIFIAGRMQAGVASANILTPRIVGIGGFNRSAYDILVDMRTKLLENNVPDINLNVWIPPAFQGVLKKDIRFSGYGTDANRATIRGAPIGDIDGMMVRVSNNCPLNGTTYTIIAAWKGACTYGEHIPDGGVEYIERFEGNFKKGARCNYVYGAKVTRPLAIATIDVQISV